MLAALTGEDDGDPDLGGDGFSIFPGREEEPVAGGLARGAVENFVTGGIFNFYLCDTAIGGDAKTQQYLPFPTLGESSRRVFGAQLSGEASFLTQEFAPGGNSAVAPPGYRGSAWAVFMWPSYARFITASIGPEFDRKGRRGHHCIWHQVNDFILLCRIDQGLRVGTYSGVCFSGWQRPGCPVFCRGRIHSTQNRGAFRGAC